MPGRSNSETAKNLKEDEDRLFNQDEILLLV